MKQTRNKECKKHGNTIHSIDPKGYYRCRKCRYDYVKTRRRKVKLKSVEYMGGSCEVCGYDTCVAALEFHHKDPSEKDFQIGCKSNASWERIKKELDKCRMVCANCHREIHADKNLN